MRTRTEHSHSGSVFSHTAMFMKFQKNFWMVLTKFNFTFTIFVQALYFIHVKAHKVLGSGMVCFIHSPIQQIAIEQLLWARHTGCWWCTNKTTGWSPVLRSCWASESSTRTRRARWFGCGGVVQGGVLAGALCQVANGWGQGRRNERVTSHRALKTTERTLDFFFFFFWVYYKLLKAFQQESNMIWCLSYKVHFERWVGFRLYNN